MDKYILVSFIVLSSGSILGWSIPGFGYLQLIVSIIILFLSYRKNHFFISQNQLLTFFSIVSVFCINVLFSSGFGVLINNINMILSFMCLLIAVMLITAQDFLEKFTNIMVVLGLLSILFWFLAQFNITIGDQVIIAGNGLYYRLNPVYIYRVGTATGIHNTPQFRNTGIFWEPGAYAGYLSLALLLLLTNKETNAKKWYFKIFVLIISIISTMSTSGYFYLVLIFVIYYFDQSKNKKIKLKTIIFFILGIIGVFIILNTDVVQMKFTEGTDVHTYSTSTRVNDNLSGIKACFVEPIFGLGFNSTEYTNVMRSYNITANSSGLLITLQQFGLIVGIVIIIRIISNIKKITNVSGLSTFFFLLYIIILFSSESFINKQIFTMFLYNFSLPLLYSNTKYQFSHNKYKHSIKSNVTV